MSIATSLTKLETDITNAYDEINTKGGTMPSNKNTNNLPNAINSIPVGKPEQSKTVNPSTSQVVVSPDTGYALSSVTVNAMPSGGLNTPTINSSTGVVTATIGTSGYLASGTNKTLQLTTQGAQTITPGTTNKTISSGKYLTGTQTIAGDANLIGANIKQGVSIFGVNGTIPNNCKVWVYNHTSSGSTGETITIETNDSWIAQNYNNSTLVMSITNINTNALAAKSLYGMIQTNTTAYGTHAGRTFRTALSSTSWADNSITRKIMDTGDVGFIATSAGKLTFRAADNGSALYFPTGTYIIVATISQ